MIDRKLNIIMTLAGAVGGIAGHFLGSAAFTLSLPRPLLAAIYMGAVGLGIVLCCVLAETLFPIVNGMNWKRNYAGITWRYLVPAALIPMLLFGGLMQLIYQTNLNMQKGRDMYMLIDRSGSMEWNDPTDERLAAVRRLVDTFDKNDRLEIIIFDHEAEVVQPLTEVGADGAKDGISAQLSQIKPRGGTDFNKALSLVYERIEANRTQKYEPVIILLSDGESEVDTNILSKFEHKGLAINTVGLLLEVKDGEAVLSYAARQTNGQFVHAENTDQLDFAFKQIYQADERFILNRKTRFNVDILQWLMFIIAGLLIGLATGFIFDNRYIFWPLSIGGLISGTAAGGLLCFPIGLLLPAILLGFLFTWFTVFSKTPPMTQTDGAFSTSEQSSFLSEKGPKPGKTHGRF